MTLIIRGDVQSFGLDYITLTQAIDNRTVEKGASERRAVERVFSMVSKAEGPKVVNFGGYTGYQDGKVKMGHRLRGDYVDKIISVSGPSSDRIFLADLVDLSELNCTRIDIQVTVKLSSKDGDLARKYFDNLRSTPSYKSSMVGRRSISLVDSETGQTLYIGKRKTRTMFARLYDKSKDVTGSSPGQYWRFEIEFHRDLAGPIFSELLDGRQGTRSEIMIAMLNEYSYDSFGVALPLEDSISIELNSPERDASNTVNWLEKCVKPVVARELDNGNAEVVLKALGLNWLIELGLIRVQILDETSPKRVQIFDKIGSQM